MNMTQEQCERAVKALQEEGWNASYVQGAPDDHGVWLDGVWDDELQNAHTPSESTTKKSNGGE